MVAGFRVLIALMWLANIHWKVPPSFGEDTGGGLYKYSESVTRHSPFAPFTWISEQIILPNFTFFGWVTLIAEIVIAGLLLIGYRTKFAALLGFAFSVPIFLSVIYYDRADEWSWAYFMMMGSNLIIYATDAGRCFGVDGALDAGPSRQRRALMGLGVLGTVVGILGLYVGRSVAFAGDQVRLLGSDAGFVDGDSLVRRWELKFLWFNPLWALLTIAFGVLLIVGARTLVAGLVGAVGYSLIAVVIFFAQTFDYVRSPDGSLQTIATGSNVAFWGALGVGAAVLLKRLGAQTDQIEEAEVSSPPQ